MVELYRQEMEPNFDTISPELRKSTVKCRTWLCAERRETPEKESTVSLGFYGG